MCGFLLFFLKKTIFSRSFFKKEKKNIFSKKKIMLRKQSSIIASSSSSRVFAAVAPKLTTSTASLFTATSTRLVISEHYWPRNYPVKATTGLAGISVEPLWKPKLIAAAAELEAFMLNSDIPPESTYYNVTMTLVRRIFAGIEQCGDDWLTLEKKYFWGWPVEYVLQLAWRELETAQKWNEWRFWELDPEQVKKIAKEDQGIGKEGAGYRAPWETLCREDYDKRKKALSQEEMAELKRMDTEKMARETAQYKERKERIKDDMERSRGEMLKKFLGKRMVVEHDLKRMKPGSIYSGKSSETLIEELKASKPIAGNPERK